MPAVDLFGSPAGSPLASPYPQESDSALLEPKGADDDESVAFAGGGGAAALSIGPPTDAFGVGSTVSPMPPANSADLTGLIQRVVGALHRRHGGRGRAGPRVLPLDGAVRYPFAALPADCAGGAPHPPFLPRLE